jgi:phosphopantothenoylcysteine synthetase/decarboxylase
VSRHLCVVVCGAGPASDVGTLIAAAQQDGWTVRIIATPAALEFLDVPALEAQTGHPVRHAYRRPHEPRVATPPPDAIIVAPATFNTINKLATGISDNYALGTVGEAIGSGVPVIVLPFINTAMAARVPLRTAVASLRDEGVDVLIGPEAFQPHSPGSGNERIATYPWGIALNRARSRALRRDSS